MAGNFKKKQRRFERSKARSNLFIPPQEIDTSTSLLPSSVAQVDDEAEPELKSLRITFEYYKEKLCGIEGLTEKQPLNTVRAIKAIGISCNKDDLSRNGVGSQIVHRANEYLDLYKGMDDESVIWEHKIKDSPARIFYELLPSEGLCRIIAITARHFETTKR